VRTGFELIFDHGPGSLHPPRFEPLIDFLLKGGLHVKHGRNAGVGCYLNDCWPACPVEPFNGYWIFSSLICAVFPSSSIPSRSSAGWLPTVRAGRAAA